MFSKPSPVQPSVVLWLEIRLPTQDLGFKPLWDVSFVKLTYMSKRYFPMVTLNAKTVFKICIG